MSALCLALLLAGGPLRVAEPAPQETPPAERPDVLLVVVDDAGWEDLVAAPADDIAALAAAGRVYTRCYASPTCSPSRYQLLFGRYPHRVLLGQALSASDGGAPTEDVSLAERLAVAGYATALFGKWHVNGAGLPIDRYESARVHGFATWRAGSFGNVGLNNSHYAWKRVDDGVTSNETRYTTLAINEALEAWWQTTDGPRFAVCAYLAPHEPFDLPPPELVPEVPPIALFPRDRFELALRGVDNAVARLATSIDLSNAWVFLVPDNGTPHNAPPTEPKSPGYKLTPYEGGVRVPLVVWGPTVLPGVDDALVQLVDLPGTILDLLGLEPRGTAADSISFAPTLTGGPGAREAALLQRFGPNGGPATALAIDDWAVLRADGPKLLASGGALELHDLAVDPWESTPLVDPPLTAALQALRAELLGPDWPYPF